VVELCAAFKRHGRVHCRKPDGSQTTTYWNVRTVVLLLVGMYGRTPASAFTLARLREVREAMIRGDKDKGRRPWSRKTCNQAVNMIRHIFKWGVESDLVDATVYGALCALRPLQGCRTEARETDEIQPVPIEWVNAVKPHVSMQVRALIELQLLTAARPGELVGLRAVDIDTRGAVWEARLRNHKTSHAGKKRTLYFGPNAKAILESFLSGRVVDAFLFSPREAVADRATQAETHRRRNQTTSPRQTDRVVGDCYTVNSYRRAIERGCRAASVPVWRPNQLRHNAATELRKSHGLDTAQVLLGHSRVDVTQVYAEVNRARALEVIGKIG
jgi:integrase